MAVLVSEQAQYTKPGNLTVMLFSGTVMLLYYLFNNNIIFFFFHPTFSSLQGLPELETGVQTSREPQPVPPESMGPQTTRQQQRPQRIRIRPPACSSRAARTSHVRKRPPLRQQPPLVAVDLCGDQSDPERGGGRSGRREAGGSSEQCQAKQEEDAASPEAAAPKVGAVPPQACVSPHPVLLLFFIHCSLFLRSLLQRHRNVQAEVLQSSSREAGGDGGLPSLQLQPNPNPGPRLPPPTVQSEPGSVSGAALCCRSAQSYVLQTGLQTGGPAPEREGGEPEELVRRTAGEGGGCFLSTSTSTSNRH